MSQSSESSSPKKMSPIAAPESVPRIEPINLNEVLYVSLLKMVTADDLSMKKTHTHMQEDSKKFFVHKVPGISVPLQYVIYEPHRNPEPNAGPREDIIGKSTNDDDDHMSGGDAHMADDYVHTPNADVQMAEEEENDDDVQKDEDNTDVTQDVNDNTEAGPEAVAGTNVVNLDDMSDSDLVANVNPSIEKRLMTRKGKKRKTIPKSTSTCPIKSKAVSKSAAVDPTKSWSKVVPKKRKAKVITDSDSDVVADVQDIPLRKKPTTSKLAASVPEVPIDNISFHYPSSVNRWKYVYQKRLALEMELAQNALESKEIMDLIHEAGLMKTVTHFSKCYEMLVKEFIVNLSEDCADRKLKDFRKVYVRGKCVTFSSIVINNYLGRSDEAQPELEVSNNKVCQVITAK
ncbi:uncharacterized protein LOC131658428 [Vicia villosa]|uniref:uncharacterized protein LOC131658428 n=1 Tax=Vicia villosa TaxID=3911 RepID=UPI00273BF938|nr:uncharacterized protein LOC131658428 [Vicia villosa]